MIISFIGGGNMASALIGGLLNAGSSLQIQVADTSPEARARLAALPGVKAFEQAADAVQGAALVVLALKPQVLPTVMRSLGPCLTTGQCVVSVAAGITLGSLRGWLANDVAAIRTMPNTPALIGLGITGMYADEHCSPDQRMLAEQVMGAGGETVWVDSEAQIDSVTAISGSGPAYFYLFTEALTDAGIQLGLPELTAKRLATQTALGAGSMLAAGDDDAATLRRKVTSPGGTTAAAIAAFEDGGLRELVRVAADAARSRSAELAAEDDDS